MTIRVCADCVHCEALKNAGYYFCKHPKSMTRSLITGEVSPTWECHEMRSITGACGPDAKLWEYRLKGYPPPEYNDIEPE